MVGAVIWPFKRTEQRSDDYTVQVVDRIETEALAGVSADALAVCEASIGLWERALSSATVTPDSRPLRAVTGPVLALAGRALASRGEAIFRIDVDGGVVSLVPASAWDIQGSATTWRYRCDFIGPSGSTTMALPAEAVVHFRTGVDTRTPWRGQSPLRRSAATARLAERIESALSREMLIPPGRLAVVPQNLSLEAAKAYGASIKRGGVSIHPAENTDYEPTSRHAPAKMGPEPVATTEALRVDTGRDILAAFGVPPALFEARGDGAGQRESWRRFWLGTMAPLAVQIQAEIRAKLDPMAVVGLEALRAADEDSRSRAVARRAAAFKTLRDASVEAGEARRLAGLT